MSPEGRKRAVLAGLLALLAVVLLRQLGGPGSGGGGRPGATRARRAADATAPAEVLDLDLARLVTQRAVYHPGRDPFRYGSRPAPPPEPVAEETTAERRAEAAAAGGDRPARGRRGGQAGPPRPRAPAVSVQYLGSFGPKADRIAVFLDGEEIINAKLGDILKGQFIVQGIGFESADLGFVGFPEEPSQRLAAGG